jgi:hypothetical protein
MPACIKANATTGFPTPSCGICQRCPDRELEASAEERPDRGLEASVVAGALIGGMPRSRTEASAEAEEFAGPNEHR